MSVDMSQLMLLLDQAAADTPELQWIAPLVFLKKRARRMADDGIPPSAEFRALCKQAAGLSAEGKSLPPDVPRRILFGQFDAACLSVCAKNPEGLRKQCACCAEFIRAVREAEPLFRRAWCAYPEPVCCEEAFAYEKAASEAEAVFGHLLRALNDRIHTEILHRQANEARYVHEVLVALPLPTILADAISARGECEFFE